MRLGLTKVDLLGFSIGGMVAQQITLDRPELIRKLILVGTAPRDLDAGNGQGHIPRDGGDLRRDLRSARESLAQGLLHRLGEEPGGRSRSILKRLSGTHGEPRRSDQR